MLQETVLHSLKTLLPKGQVFTDRASLLTYEVDAGLDRGLPDGVVFPRTVNDIVRLMRWSIEHHVPLIARGAGTGLSGGAVADRGGIIVEFSHMDHILDVDAYGRSAVVESCVINLALDERVKAHGLYFPPDPASQRASTIGGNVAENSGGLRGLKYGITRNYVMGLEVVLPDGEILWTGNKCVKDVAGYSIKDLFVGSEGTFGIATEATVKLLPVPQAVRTLLADFTDVDDASRAVSAIISAGMLPSALEMMDNAIIRAVEASVFTAGLPTDAQAVLLVELDGIEAGIDDDAAQAESQGHQLPDVGDLK